VSALACRLCGSMDGETFLDLGAVPLANALLPPDAALSREPRYPLRLRFCRDCLLVQLESIVEPERLFTHYVFSSSYSQTWMAHCAAYVDRVCERLDLTPAANVVEIGSNDGHLLRMFQRRGIPVLGIEPAANIAAIAEADGVPTEVAFFNAETARNIRERFPADLIIANNVFAHVPAIDSFVQGLALLLKPGGTVTVEVPHILRMILELQADTIYHEHVFYFSLRSIDTALSRQGLSVYDLELLPTHGGSLRIYAARGEDGRPVSDAVFLTRQAERDAGLYNMETYRKFADAVAAMKLKLAEFFCCAAHQGRRIVGYGASAKAVGLLNLAGAGARFLDFVVDRSPYKQGLLIPGAHVPIYAPERVFETRPDYLLILAWNLKDEVMKQMSGIDSWGGKFVTPVPEPKIVP